MNKYALRMKIICGAQSTVDFIQKTCV